MKKKKTDLDSKAYSCYKEKEGFEAVKRKKKWNLNPIKTFSSTQTFVRSKFVHKLKGVCSGLPQLQTYSFLLILGYYLWTMLI